MRAVGYVHTKRISRRVGRPNQTSREQETRTTNQKRIYVDGIAWGFSTLTPEFGNFLNEEIDDLIDKSEIKKECAMIIDKIITKMKNKPNCTAFLPTGDECPICHSLHDSHEFIMALVYSIGQHIRESSELDKVLKKHGFNT